MDIRQDWHRIVCAINCISVSARLQAEEVAKEQTDPDYTITRTIRCGGIQHETHRFGDWFESAEIEPGESNLTFYLIFNARKDVSTNWKSFLMGVLRAIKSIDGIEIEFVRNKNED